MAPAANTIKTCNLIIYATRCNQFVTIRCHESQMIAYRLEKIPLSEPTTSFKFLQQERAGFSLGDTAPGLSDSAQLDESRFLATNYSLFGQAGTGLMRGAGAVQPTAYSGPSDAEFWGVEGFTDQFTTLRDASKEALSGLTSDIRTTNAGPGSLSATPSRTPASSSAMS